MSTIFTDIKAPYINRATLERKLASAVKENVFQGLFTKDGEAVTEKFSTDTDCTEIQVIRVKPDGIGARQIGTAINGGFFSSADAVQPTTAAYGIKIIQTIDHNIDIPTNMQDMIGIDLAEGVARNLAGVVDRNINAATLAAYIATSFNSGGGTAAPANLVSLGSTVKWINSIVEANSYLDDGNSAEGIDAYPSDNRALFIRAGAKKELMASGSLITGVTNSVAQRMLAAGGFSEGVKLDMVRGYAGEIDGVPVYVAAKVVWDLAEAYLGLDAGSLDGLHGLLVSGVGTGRALAFNGAIKQIPSPAGQGIRIQPKYRFGVECWDALSVVPITTAAFKSSFTTDFADIATAKLEVIAPGSRA